MQWRISAHDGFRYGSSTVHHKTRNMKLNLINPDFERYTSDQQFVNVVDALERMEHQKGGLSVEEVWEMAWQVVEMLRKASRPEVTVKRLLTQINDIGFVSAKQI